MLGLLLMPLHSRGDAWPWWVLVPYLHPASPAGSTPGSVPLQGCRAFGRGKWAHVLHLSACSQTRLLAWPEDSPWHSKATIYWSHVGVRAWYGSFPSVVL